MVSAGSPLRNRTSPGTSRTSSTLSASHRSCSSGRSANTPTRLNAATRSSGELTTVLIGSTAPDTRTVTPTPSIVVSSISNHLAQVLMYKGDRNGAFADSGSHALHRAVTHVSDYKNTGNVCFQKTWSAVQLPSLRRFTVAHQIGTGENEAALVAFDNVREPVCVRRRANHDEERVGGHPVGMVGRRAVN